MTRSADHPRRWLRAAALGTALVAGGMLAPAAYGQAVVQPLPDPAQLRLNEALRILAQDPRSLTGLLAAGQASLALDDVDSALGFFRRAEAVSPAHGGVKAGLASVLARREQPVEALRLFAEAEAAGEPMLAHAAERGLAYDLVGDNFRAQQEYQLALTQGESATITRRLAISQAISGDQRASEATLLPLLQRRDLAAYRSRAFALAILGKSEEAVSIAETMLPERLSSRMSPYLRYMPRLTRAQQAAAANLGVFPRAAQIGRDDPALAALASQQPAPPAATTADARLVPAGEPLGRREGVIPRPQERSPAPAPTPAPAPAPAPAVVAAVVPPPAPTQPTPAPAPTPEPVPVTNTAAVATPPQAVPAAPIDPPPAAQPVVVAVAEPSPDMPRPQISIADQPAAPVATPPVQPVSLSDAFADFSLPSGAPTIADGAVDITAIQPKREAPPKPAPPPKPVAPSRQWVQVATGRDVDALGFDWRRIKRAAGGLLDKSPPHVVSWGQTNRLVAGPFASAREAQEMVAKLKEKQIDSFRFTSDQGEEVKPLG